MSDSEFTEAERQAMRKRWAQRRAARLARPAPIITPDQLHARAVADCERRKAWSLRMAAHHREKQAEAKAAGELGIARTLGMLAANLEQSAALAEAERRDRIARFEHWQRTESNRAKASKPRPGRRRPIKDAILQALAPLKREGIEFRTLMRRWRAERIESLRLVDLGGGRFRITDENGDEASASATYRRGTLQRLYSESKRLLTTSAG